jgi:hypothetical protein
MIIIMLPWFPSCIQSKDDNWKILIVVHGIWFAMVGIIMSNALIGPFDNVSVVQELFTSTVKRFLLSLSF